MPTAGWLRRPDLPLDAAGRSYIDAPSLDQILDQFVNWRGDVNAGGFKLVGYAQSAPGNIEVGAGVPGNRNAWIDLIGDDTYTDFGLRIIRNATGPDASSDLIHRGTGELRMISNESGPISMFMGVTKIFNFAANGIQFPDGTIQASAGVPATRQIIAGTGLTGGGDLTANRTLSVVNNTSAQKVNAGVNGAALGPRWWLNFVAGANVVLSAADNPGGDRVDITINSTGGGTGGSQTPWLSDIDAAGFRLLNAGAIGIGTSNPLRGLHLAASGSAEFLIEDVAVASATGGRIWRTVNNSGGVLGFDAMNGTLSGGLRALTILPSGNVGIGTSAPDALLALANPGGPRIGDAVGSELALFKAICHDNASYDSHVSLRGLRHTAGSTWDGFGLRLQHKVQSSWMSYLEFNAAGPAAGMAFGYGASEYMRIHANGYVGIRTTTPSNILTVQETQPDVQDPAVPPRVAVGRCGLLVKGVFNLRYGACIQMGAAGGLGWAIKQTCHVGNEGDLSIYGALNVDAKMHEMVRFSANSPVKLMIRDDALGGGDATQGPRIMFDWPASSGAPRASIGISNNGGSGTIRTFNGTGTGYAIFESNLIYIRNAAAPSLQLDGMNSTWATLQWEPSSGLFSISTVWASVGKSLLYITGDGNVYLPYVNTVAGSAGSGKLYRSGNQLLIS